MSIVDVGFGFIVDYPSRVEYPLNLQRSYRHTCDDLT